MLYADSLWTMVIAQPIPKRSSITLLKQERERLVKKT